jgi:hypothetical protein
LFGKEEGFDMTVNMGTVWDRTTEFLSDNLSALASIALLAIFLPLAIGDLVNQAGPALGTPVMRIVGLLCSLINLWGQLAIVALALDPDAGRAAAQAAATRGYGRALLVMVVVFVAMAVLALPILGVLFASGVDMTQLAGTGGAAAAPDISPGTGAFLGLYGMALLIVLLFVTVRLAPVYPVILAEGLGLAAIGRSFAVTRGITWKLVGVWLLFLVVFLVATGAARSVFGLVVGLMVPGEGPFTAASIVAALAGALITTAFTALVAAFSARLYLAVTRFPAVA